MLLRVPLDGSITATGPDGKPLAGTAADGLSFVEGKSGQAASLGDGQFVEYPLSALKLETGALVRNFLFSAAKVLAPQP